MKTNIHIYQVLGIIVLLCGYLFSNTPDSLSDMSFNLKCQTVISKAHKHARNYDPPAKVSKNDSRHRTDVVKHISFEVVVPAQPLLNFYPVATVEHSAPLIEGYNYLYYLEINPPPPRQSAQGLAVA